MVGRLGEPWGAAVRENAESATERTATLTATIEELGSAPYPTYRFTASLCSTAGWLLGTASRRAAMYASRRATSHALAEYAALAALVEGAAGVPENLVDTVKPLLATAVSDAAALRETGADGDLPSRE
jgi:hypothetical protein